MPSAGAVVAIPAHDEAERLPAALASLAAQEGFGPDTPLRVLVLANNCRDGTAEVAAGFAASPAGASLALEVVSVDLPPASAHVGTARRLAMDGAADRAGPAGVLLTTDADARLPPDWVRANLAALQGAEIVGGRLVVDASSPDDPLEALHRAVELYWRSVRALEERIDPQPHDPAPRHGDHTGASLALRVETYWQAGGCPALPRGEDNALVARVVEAGGRLRHDPRVSVRVSDRAVGRVAGGMATEMGRRRAVLAGQEAYCLPEPAHWERVVRRRAALRAAWRRGAGEAELILGRLGLSATEAASVAPRACRNDIAFVERAHRLLDGRNGPPALVPLAVALARFGAASADA